ncbi:uncharacterized protein BT62DRAFT_721694 [Guyanagaster necrorhizus]|uniref:Uncharacterized protein n=1 Tax=Guyanagaster necrorhizus TaxID=856835 RepID=A0A9P7VXD3_9AGAR|nr:uncharacterized protein BT62DRAFT_721694 [Guyanagaster necrorhizus MCA 3950]KAG7448689.1 hypothetical protein BT62DRAFT_721694 [Guyanagaster necrorhizus MCA 3950]
MDSQFSVEKNPIFSSVLSEGTLTPITSNATGRYDRECITINLKPALISPGSSEPEPIYLPPHWTSHVHPEGQLYFCRDAPFFVVTEAYLFHIEIMAKVALWTKRIEDLLDEKKIRVSRSTELFIKIEEDDCAYYFVDHATRTEFWLDIIETDALGLPDMASPSHLRTYLESLYWSHVEHFPMHIGGLPKQTYDDLIGIFSHGLADQMTSGVSTFFYSQQECATFLKVLKSGKDQNEDGYQTCVAARLWSIVCNHRFSVYYGQEFSRLSRDQAVLYHPEENVFLESLMSFISLGQSTSYSKGLDDIFVDRLVYVDQWRPFMSKCLSEWKDAVLFTSSTSMLHLPLVFVPGVPMLTAVSIALFTASVIASMLLIHRHRRLEKASANQAFQYLVSVYSLKNQFHLVALMYSLPTFLHLWGLGALVANCIVIVSRLFGFISGVVVSIILVFALVAFEIITTETELSSWRSVFRFRSQNESGDQVV